MIRLTIETIDDKAGWTTTETVEFKSALISGELPTNQDKEVPGYTAIRVLTLNTTAEDSAMLTEAAITNIVDAINKHCKPVHAAYVLNTLRDSVEDILFPTPAKGGIMQ